MLSVSGRWAPTLATDHGVSVSVSALYNGSVVADDLDFVDGAVQVDRGSDTRRTLSLTIDDPKLFPDSETARFGVYGQELYVEAGLAYLDGTTETVPLGFFVIKSVSGNIHTGPLTIQADGRELLCKRAVFETAQSTAGHANAAAFIRTHLEDVVPAAGFVDDSSSGTTALASKTWERDTEVWSALVDVATSVGAELYCDANGTFRLVDVPEIGSAVPVWTVAAGEGGVMVSADMAVTGDGVYNRVVVAGENSSDDAPPVIAEASITDPDDPLRYGGPFGRVTKTYSSSLITSIGAAQGAANALLRQYRAANRTVSLSAVPNPALDAGDCIRVDYGDAAPPELHLVQSFTVPLDVGGGDFTIATMSGKDDQT
ncbi:DUF5047 domain-containing protein [Streptomyces sp. NPDC050145]|uniref:DUF5047 domain-containing protein n=1 Tax=Streptomyces sp. NPDC050145 TaxID=3365602 RepID=UPI003796169C